MRHRASRYKHRERFSLLLLNRQELETLTANRIMRLHRKNQAVALGYTNCRAYSDESECNGHIVAECKLCVRHHNELCATGARIPPTGGEN